MTDAPAGVRQLTGAEFRDVIGHFASGVTVITVTDGGRALGTTASAVSSLSLEPPMVLICMNETSSTGAAVASARAFAINILAEGQDDVARRFATKGDDKFAGTPTDPGPFGQPLLQQALATIECEVVEAVTGGTHTVFIGEVRSATSRAGAPLAYFRGEFGRLQLARDDHVYTALRERLLNRQLPVGRSLEPADLATGLEVPAGPVYYALGRLGAEGMLERTPAGGFRVPPVTGKTIDEAVDACCAMELGAVDQTIGQVDDRALDRWRAAMETTLTHVAPGAYIDVDTSVDANARFHEMLIAFTGSEPLLAAYRRVALSGIIARAFPPRMSETETDRAYGQDHRDIFEAFADGDSVGARQAVLRHGGRIKSAFRAV